VVVPSKRWRAADSTSYRAVLADRPGAAAPGNVVSISREKKTGWRPVECGWNEFLISQRGNFNSAVRIRADDYAIYREHAAMLFLVRGGFGFPGKYGGSYPVRSLG